MEVGLLMADLASGFAQANQPVVKIDDPNTVLQRSADAQNALMTNRLAQANQAVGQAYQGAIDPETGKFDPLAFNRLAAANPRAAMAAGQAVQQSQALQGAQLQQGNARLGAISNALGAVRLAPDGQVHAAAARAMEQLVGLGVVPRDEANLILAQAPNDESQLRGMIDQMSAGLLDQQGQRTVVYGQQGVVNDGNRQHTVITPVPGRPNAGVPQVTATTRPAAYASRTRGTCANWCGSKRRAHHGHASSVSRPRYGTATERWSARAATGRSARRLALRASTLRLGSCLLVWCVPADAMPRLRLATRRQPPPRRRQRPPRLRPALRPRPTLDRLLRPRQRPFRGKARQAPPQQVLAIVSGKALSRRTICKIWERSKASARVKCSIE